MARRDLLHKSRLQEFLDWCVSEKKLMVGSGMGDYQLALIRTQGGTWHVIYSRLKMPEHVTVPEPLVPLVLNFLRSTKK